MTDVLVWAGVAVLGGLGAVARLTVDKAVSRRAATAFPYGTLVVNLAGCFIIGLLFALADRSRLLTPDVRLVLITGYLGALTTFSSFAVETINAGRAGLLQQAVTNIVLNNVGGLTLTYLGLRLGSLRWGM